MIQRRTFEGSVDQQKAAMLDQRGRFIDRLQHDTSVFLGDAHAAAPVEVVADPELFRDDETSDLIDGNDSFHLASLTGSWPRRKTTTETSLRLAPCGETSVRLVGRGGSRGTF